MAGSKYPPELARLLQESPGDRPRPRSRQRHPLTPVQVESRLRTAVRRWSGEFPERIKNQAGKKKFRVFWDDYDSCDIDGDISLRALVGSQKSSARRVDFAVEPGSGEVFCDCSCGKDRCIHEYRLLTETLNQLDDDDSELVTHIYDGPRPKEGAPTETGKSGFERLLNLIDNAALPQRVVDAPLSLDQTPRTNNERIAWNLEVSHASGAVSLKPLAQKEKKNGGWTKGRSISVERFEKMSRENWSSSEHAVAAGLERTYWDEPVLDFGNALAALVGAGNVMLNHQPVRVKQQSFFFVVFEMQKDDVDVLMLATSVRERLREMHGRADDVATINADNRVVICSEQCGEIRVAEFPENGLNIAEELTSNQLGFTHDQKSLLLKQVDKLRTIADVKLPDCLVQATEPDELQLTLLLNMRKSGELEAMVCLRDHNACLIKSGTGPMIRCEERDGLHVQLLREAETERRRAEKLTADLNLYQHLELPDDTWCIESSEAIIEFMTRVGDHVNTGEVVVAWHKASAREFNIMGSVSARNVQVEVSKNRDWFGVNGTCRIGNDEIPLQDVLQGLRGNQNGMQGFIELNAGNWAAITDEFKATLQKLADVAHESRGKLQIDSSAAMALAAIEEHELSIEADKSWQRCLKKVKKIETINPDPPAALDCDLREYQLAGFRWMCRLAEWGVGGILADDMGLGKTVQTLAVLLQRIESGPALVIAPTSLGFNWEAECRRFTPSLTPKLFRDGDRQAMIESASEGDVIICSYGLALREVDLLKSVKWGTLVLDEAQAIKNSNAQTSKAIRKLNADWKVALTGTPMENHLGELWSIFRAVSPGILGAWEQFRKKFATPIEKNGDDERRRGLSQVLAPFILRRSKKEVLTDLPDRSESNILVELSPDERKRYDQVRLAAIGELDEVGGEELSHDSRFRVLQLLTRLRQISCHVGLIDESWDQGSSKLTMLTERLQQLKERGHRVLVFSQFTSHLKLIKDACEEHSITFQYLDGQTTPKARQNRVEAFQNGDDDVFLISLKAGGTGLNLTAADYVIHMDPWWNPAVEDQATDRAHRIGQTKSVMVYRFIAKGTIEEKILTLHAEKRDLVEGVLSGSEAAGRMTTEQLADLIRAGASGRVAQ